MPGDGPADLLDVLTPTGLRTGEALPRATVHRRGLPHRAVHIYLVNPRGELLLQCRAATVDHYPNVLSISVVGHVDAGESSSAAARRELFEELGLDTRAAPLEFLFSHYQEATLAPDYIDRQFNDVYVARAQVDRPALRPAPRAVAATLWLPLERFAEMVAARDPAVAPVYAAEFRDVQFCLARA